MTTHPTTYHVMLADDGDVIALFRFRRDATGAYHESYRRGEGWVESTSAADVFRNGQDYDVIDEAEAERLAAKLERDEE